ncbi:MAG: signal peptidase I [Kiritimatiellae bacterium]|nr:signal peptidase I [Kiritimatiellia bacterium]
MNFWERRKWRKRAHEALHHARITRAMREDIAGASELEELDGLVETVKSALDGGRFAELPAAIERMVARCDRARPRMSHAAENFEVLVVALSVAMGLRTFFLQPFRIPTGSMQPTLYGIHLQDDAVRRWYDRMPFSIPGWAIFGTGFIEVRAKTSGVVAAETQSVPGRDVHYLFVNGVPHKIRDRMPMRVQPGQQVVKGQVLASGRLTIGDHVLVNKLRYNFSRPRRGDIAVFETQDIKYPNLQGSFYIKRLAGMPGETISIQPPHLLADHQIIREPEPFRRMVEDPAYAGYVRAMPTWPRPQLMEENDAITLGPQEYLPLGDNTRASLDGRYFGAIPEHALVGPAAVVYWPMSRRWGWAR